MKRKLFFLLDRLQISRSERISISILILLTVALTIVFQISEPKANYSEEYYAELESIFAERSRTIEAERQEILQRYQPFEEDEAQAFTVTADTTLLEKEAPVDTVLININTADSETLQKLPGIGPAYAERIIEWRMENGKFESKEQLLEIRGIGPVRLDNIRSLIKIE